MISKTYTKDDVIRLYKQAKDKKKEIKILAELTCSDFETILAILEDAGEFSGDYKVCARCGLRFPVVSTQGRGYCPKCRAKERKISELKYELKRITAEIQQLGLKSARIRAEIERLKDEVH